ncbi:7TM diverse intracellular signaling domain-containing protein [Spirosoma aerolatum]|uniref:7TM diverse intracellular signaling domain-containing protein n=1 Tax=Spirosoma aerolatum TaxID=1211326 RepID=UPI0009AF13EA|nr:7TM diverse intracellular signaling domain-containing protein [Spirosoma aerolatum]
MKSLLFTLFLFLVVKIVQAQSVTLSNPDQTYLIFENCAALPVEPGQKITIDSLLHHPEKYSFAPLKQTSILPNANRFYWLKVDLTNPTPDNYFLRFLQLGDMVYRGFEVNKNQLINTWQVDLNGVATTNRFQHSRGIIPLQLREGQTHTLFIYVHQDGIPTLHVSAMSSQMLAEDTHYQDLFYGLGYGFILIITIYSLLLGIRLKDRDNVLYAIVIIISGISTAQTYGAFSEFPGNWPIVLKHNYGVLLGVGNCVSILFTISFLQLRQRANGLYWVGNGFLGIYAIGSLGILGLYLTGEPDGKLQYYFALLITFTGLLFRLIAGIVVSMKRYVPALFFTFGQFSSLTCVTIFALSQGGVLPFNFWARNSLVIGYIAEIICYLLGLTYKINQLKKKQEEAILEQLRLTQENQTLIETQNRVLEEKVEQRTAELKASQAQLIQKEKLASLGELTAGIAHEIQNPLNFVNNFSEVSAELIQEQKEALAKGDLDEVGFLADDLTQNLQKIAHHGRRAETIVKGMLEHSRASSGERHLADLNKLADEYLRLAYQGQRAKDNSFTCQLVTSFDPTIPAVHLVGQDMGRVLLNLYNNAFYAVRQRERQQGNGFQPVLEVSSYKQNGYVSLRIKDNGIGIQESVKGKLFQPFFTTKPPGEGTGLGLSLSYDIVTKGHAGSLLVDSQEGNGATFIVQLPS